MSKLKSKLEIQPVFDFGEMHGQVLIIARDARKYELAARFLSERNWLTSVCYSTHEALQYLIEEKPNFIFVSFNHPNKRVLELPLWVPTNAATTCIAFSETPGPKTLKRIHDDPIFEYKMFKNASGPTFSLRIRQILYTRFHEQLTQNRRVKNPSKESLGLTSLRPPRIKKSNKHEELRRILASHRLNDRTVEKQPLDKKVVPLDRPLSDSVSQALKKISIPKVTPFGDLTRTRSVSVLPVFMRHKTGYLLLASNLGKNVNSDLIKQLKTNLDEQPKHEKTSLLMDADLSVETPSVDFCKWANAHGDFVLTHGNEKGQLASTFISKENPLPMKFKKNDQNKVPLQIKDFPVEQPVNFEDFLFLKQKNKYLVYLKPGGKLSESQKEKLLECNEDLFIDAKDSSAYKKLFIKNEINRCIEKFQTQQTQYSSQAL